MNQSKFKFGDLVQLNAHAVKYNDEKPFIIKRMELWQGGIMIWTSAARMIHESHFELYQEPQKKKLYAYRVPGKSFEIKTFATELDEVDAKTRNLFRFSDYDIEYPIKKEVPHVVE